MTVDQQLSRIDRSVLYPPFERKLVQLVENCNARNAHYWATNALRTHEEQNLLYAKGRTVPPLGKTVTNAKGGSSPHQYGVAADMCFDLNPDKAGLQPEYKKSQYLILAEEATKLGLGAGYYWKTKAFPKGDAPHVELPIKAMGYKWSDLNLIWRKGGLKAVYAELDRWQESNGIL